MDSIYLSKEELQRLDAKMEMRNEAGKKLALSIAQENDERKTNLRIIQEYKSKSV